jgi:hypothetical protein
MMEGVRRKSWSAKSYQISTDFALHMRAGGYPVHLRPHVVSKAWFFNGFLSQVSSLLPFCATCLGITSRRMKLPPCIPRRCAHLEYQEDHTQRFTGTTIASLPVLAATGRQWKIHNHCRRVLRCDASIIHSPVSTSLSATRQRLQEVHQLGARYWLAWASLRR